MYMLRITKCENQSLTYVLHLGNLETTSLYVSKQSTYILRIYIHVSYFTYKMFIIKTHLYGSRDFPCFYEVSDRVSQIKYNICITVKIKVTHNVNKAIFVAQGSETSALTLFHSCSVLT